MMGMKQLVVAFLTLTLLVLACGEAGDVQTPFPEAMEAAVRAVAAETQTNNVNVAEPNLEGTITARVQATVHALLAATPIPSPTPTEGIPTLTPIPTIFTTITGGAFNTAPASIPTRTPLPTPIATGTPRLTQLAQCSLAADGTVITAWVNGIQAASATVTSGRYFLLVEQPSNTSFTGQMVNFKVGDSEAKQTVQWTQGGATELILSALGDSLSNFNPNGLAGRPLAQPLPPHVVLGTAFVGHC